MPWGWGGILNTTRVCHWLHWVSGQSRFNLIWRNSESKPCERKSMPTTFRGLWKEGGDHEYNPEGAGSRVAQIRWGAHGEACPVSKDTVCSLWEGGSGLLCEMLYGWKPLKGFWSRRVHVNHEDTEFYLLNERHMERMRCSRGQPGLGQCPSGEYWRICFKKTLSHQTQETQFCFCFCSSLKKLEVVGLSRKCNVHWTILMTT